MECKHTTTNMDKALLWISRAFLRGDQSRFKFISKDRESEWVTATQAQFRYKYYFYQGERKNKPYKIQMITL